MRLELLIKHKPKPSFGGALIRLIFEAANGLTLHDLPASSHPSNSNLGWTATLHTQMPHLCRSLHDGLGGNGSVA